MSKRRALSAEQKRKKALRAAELRAKRKQEKLRRSRAAKKGWQTRRENNRLRAELRASQERTAELEASNQALREQVEKLETTTATQKTANERLFDVMTGKLPVKEYLSKEEYAAAVQELYDMHFREFTPEERQNAMAARWREVQSLQPSPGRSWYGQVLLWVQRNGFDLKEFWAEYRRRKT